jgi:heme-degrading monooxygenase HmoA
MPTEKQVFRVELRMEINPGMAAEFEKAWLTGAELIASEPANLDQWLCASAEEPDVYHVTSDWVDEASFRGYERSERHLAVRTGLRPFRVGGSMRTATVVHQVHQVPGEVR